MMPCNMYMPHKKEVSVFSITIVSHIGPWTQNIPILFSHVKERSSVIYDNIANKQEDIVLKEISQLPRKQIPFDYIFFYTDLKILLSRCQRD